EAFLRIARQIDETLFADTETYFDYIQSRWNISAGSETETPVVATDSAAGTGPTGIITAGSATGTWETVLREGVYRKAGISYAPSPYNAAEVSGVVAGSQSVPARSGSMMYCLLTPSYALYDGRLANN